MNGPMSAQGTVQVGIALAFGFTIVSMAFAVGACESMNDRWTPLHAQRAARARLCTGHISGGHLNCAVTFAFVVARKISVTRGICYFISQMLGGMATARIICSLAANGERALRAGRACRPRGSRTPARGDAF